MSRPRLIALLLALGTLVVFLPVGSFQFINYDDDDYVANNHMVQGGLTLAGVKWAFTTGYANNWHPLTWLSHMADCEFFKLNAGAHHFVNVLFHAANGALLFVLLLRLTGKIWPAAFIAALFAWHPLHVESVAWVAERKDVLSAFFALLALLSYAKYVELSRAQRPEAKVHFALSLLLFALGLMSKPMLVTLPFAMLLLDWWPLQRLAGHPLPAEGLNPPGWRLVLEKWPFFLLTIFSCVITFQAQSRVFHGSVAVTSLENVPLNFRLGNLPLACVGYLCNFFWPAKLAVFYPLPKTLLIPAVAADALVLLAISAAAWRWRKSRPYFAMGWLWFLGMLVPVSGLVMVGGASLADRYTYLPLIGIFIIIAFAAGEIAARFPSARKFFCVAAAIVLIGCVFATEKQLAFWKDSETLFRHALATTADNDIARNDLGFALEQRGDLTGALEQYQAAARFNDQRDITHNNLGSLLSRLGRHEESLAEYRKAIRLQPNDPATHIGAGAALNALGQFDAALAEFAITEKLDPQYSWAHVETAQVYFKLGRDDDGVNELRAALRLAPGDYQILTDAAHYLAATESAAVRDGKAALALALKANEISGRSQPMVFDVLGMACAENGDFTNAQICAENALTLATAARMKNLESLHQRLELYKNKKPWRESFRVTQAPAKP